MQINLALYPTQIQLKTKKRTNIKDKKRRAIDKGLESNLANHYDDNKSVTRRFEGFVLEATGLKYDYLA